MSTDLVINAAQEIRAELELAHTALGDAYQHYLNAGSMLIEQKAQLKHGEWLPWLKDNIRITEREAQRYMQLAEHRDDIESSNASRMSDLSLTGALEQIKKPRKQPSTTEVGEMLQGLDTRSPEERLAVARERLRQDSEWTDQQVRKHARLVEMVEDIQTQLAAVTEPGLSDKAIARELRDTGVKGRHLISALDELAFTFDR